MCLGLPCAPQLSMFLPTQAPSSNCNLETVSRTPKSNFQIYRIRSRDLLNSTLGTSEHTYEVERAPTLPSLQSEQCADPTPASRFAGCRPSPEPRAPTRTRQQPAIHPHTRPRPLLWELVLITRLQMTPPHSFLPLLQPLSAYAGAKGDLCKTGSGLSPTQA